MQIIKKDKKVYCVTQIDYPPKIVKSMKQAGYVITKKQSQIL